MELNRKPNPKEDRLLEILVKKALITFPDNWKENLLVRLMDDGEMGSLYLFPNGKILNNRVLGEQVSEFQFFDEDGIDVIASLNIDDKGNLFELDIWKTDFSKLIKLPDIDTEQSIV
jgi:hypothetical protein